MEEEVVVASPAVDHGGDDEPPGPLRNEDNNLEVEEGEVQNVEAAEEVVPEGGGVENNANQVAADQGDALVSLLERVNPTIPAPNPEVAAQVDASGWCKIAQLGSTLCQFPMLEECPSQHQKTFVSAWEEVLRRVEGAGSEEQLELALMWLLFLPQALLRKPTRGSRVQSRQGADS